MWKKTQRKRCRKQRDIRLVKAASHFFHDTDPSMVRAREPMLTVAEGLVPCRNGFREIEKQKCRAAITAYFRKITQSMPASVIPEAPGSTSAAPETAGPPPPPPPRQRDPCLRHHRDSGTPASAAPETPGPTPPLPLPQPAQREGG